MKVFHWGGNETWPAALGPGGSCGSVQIPVTLCGTYGYGVEFAKALSKVTCKSCTKTKLFKSYIKHE